MTLALAIEWLANGTAKTRVNCESAVNRRPLLAHPIGNTFRQFAAQASNFALQEPRILGFWPNSATPNIDPWTTLQTRLRFGACQTDSIQNSNGLSKP